MASGKKNYFRHSIFARKDSKLVQLIDDHGKEAYFHYFALLELCAEVASNAFPANGEFVFRRSTLCHELRVTNSRLGRHLVAMESALLCKVVVTEKECRILLPNLSKYMGKYQDKNDSNSPNKRKEKERKEKKSKEKESGGGFVELTGPKTDDFLNLWNTELVPLGCKHAPLTLSPNAAMDYFKIKKLLEKNSMTVADYVEKIKQCDFLLRKKKGGLNITFALNEDNCFKIISGAYEEPEMSDDEAVAKFHSLLTGGM